MMPRLAAAKGDDQCMIKQPLTESSYEMGNELGCDRLFIFILYRLERRTVCRRGSCLFKACERQESRASLPGCHF